MAEGGELALRAAQGRGGPAPCPVPLILGLAPAPTCAGLLCAHHGRVTRGQGEGLAMDGQEGRGVQWPPGLGGGHREGVSKGFWFWPFRLGFKVHVISRKERVPVFFWSRVGLCWSCLDRTGLSERSSCPSVGAAPLPSLRPDSAGAGQPCLPGGPAWSLSGSGR